MIQEANTASESLIMAMITGRPHLSIRAIHGCSFHFHDHHTRYDRSSEYWSSCRARAVALICCEICSQTRKQFADNLITSHLMVDDKEQGVNIGALFGTDIPSEMPLRGREEDESIFFVHHPLYRVTFEGSSQHRDHSCAGSAFMGKCDQVHSIHEEYGIYYT